MKAREIGVVINRTGVSVEHNRNPPADKGIAMARRSFSLIHNLAKFQLFIS
jgi:hypothetical protein